MREVAQPDQTRRWEGDQRGFGLAGASGLVARLEQLVEHARRPDWVAEEPEAHLWPHLERAIAATDSPWRHATHSTDPDGRFVVDLEYSAKPGEGGRARLRADALALVALVAEGSTFVEVIDPEADSQGQAVHAGAAILVDVLTGMLDDQTRFRSHGHSIRIRIRVRPT